MFKKNHIKTRSGDRADGPQLKRQKVSRFTELNVESEYKVSLEVVTDHCIKLGFLHSSGFIFPELKLNFVRVNEETIITLSVWIHNHWNKNNSGLVCALKKATSQNCSLRAYKPVESDVALMLYRFEGEKATVELVLFPVLKKYLFSGRLVEKKNSIRCSMGDFFEQTYMLGLKRFESEKNFNQAATGSSRDGSLGVVNQPPGSLFSYALQKEPLVEVKRCESQIRLKG